MMTPARRLWVGFETVHAVTYFAPQCLQANREAGLRGFWMGYFASRAAPLGAASAAEIAHAFYGFRPSMVERSIPDAWSFADPEAVLDTRAVSAAAALRSAIPDLDEQAAAIVGPLEIVADDPHMEGALAGPNRQLVTRHDPVERVWQACTTLREHRGDVHVSALRLAELDPCESLVLFSASGGAPRERLQPSRGWSDEEWEEASERLARRELLAADSAITAAGQRIRARVEEVTDQRAIEPWAAIGAWESDRVSSRLGLFAAEIAESGLISYPNPIGLPRR